MLVEEERGRAWSEEGLYRPIFWTAQSGGRLCRPGRAQLPVLNWAIGHGVGNITIPAATAFPALSSNGLGDVGSPLEGRILFLAGRCAS
jgi:hypothetical protein